MILASFNKPHNIVHSFSHLNWGQSRFTTFKITVIYILVNIKRLDTMNVKLVLHFSYSEHFLILIPIFSSYVFIWIHEQDLVGFSQNFLVSQNFMILLCNLFHFVIKKSMRIFLPLNNFQKELTVFEMVELNELFFSLVSYDLNIFQRYIANDGSTRLLVIFYKVIVSDDILKNIDLLFFSRSVRVFTGNNRIWSRRNILFENLKSKFSATFLSS